MMDEEKNNNNGEVMSQTVQNNFALRNDTLLNQVAHYWRRIFNPTIPPTVTPASSAIVLYTQPEPTLTIGIVPLSISNTRISMEAAIGAAPSEGITVGTMNTTIITNEPGNTVVVGTVATAPTAAPL